MRALCIWAIALAAFGQNPPDVPPAESETVRVLGVYATNEGREAPFFDAELKRYRSLLDHLPYDTFHVATDQRAEAPYGQETMIPIDAQYSMVVVPGASADPQNISLDTRVEMLRGNSYVTALGGRAEISPGKALLFKGLPRSQGELALILGIVQKPNDQQGQGSSDENEQSESESEQEQDQEQSQAGTEDQQDQQEQEEASPEDEQESKTPEEEEAQEEEEDMAQNTEEQSGEDAEEKSYAEEEASEDAMQNIDAILQHLEELDREEQKESRNQARRFVVRGDWW